METAAKTDVVIAQELIAIHTARKEACEKLAAANPDEAFTAKLTARREQSEQFTKELLDELSLYGDAVLSEVNRDNRYLQTWEKISGNLNNPDSAGNPAQLFNTLEKELLSYYHEITATQPEEPGSLLEVINRQYQALQEP